MEQWQKDLIKDVNGLHKVYLCAENKFILKGKVRIKLKKDSVFLMKIKKRKGYFFPYQKKVKGKWNDNIWDGRIEAETTYYDDIPLSIWLYPFPNKTDSCKPGFYLK
ncbi:MAG: hypothetical protein K0S32_101 [Bacteroidetes bacterium]|jgi:hypothetical protein|nr:hypothetical protein [Bacteroidota bacterium]